MSTVVEVPHCPADGVNVYVVVPTDVVFIAPGLQVPDIPFVDLVGNNGAVLFWQSELTRLNDGVTIELIVTAIVVGVPHCPELGVNVYVVVPTVAVLIAAGFQVPVIPLVDVVGNAGAMAF
jgi:hypothetical protein